MESSNKEHYIFYIQYSSKLPDAFFSMAKCLKHLNITLLPILPSELANMAKAQQQFIISITSDLASKSGLRSIRARFLDFALVNQKFCLFDLSSFGKISISYKLEKKKAYHYHALPMSFNEAAANVALQYFRQLGEVKSWPGGKRASIPSNLGEL